MFISSPLYISHAFTDVIRLLICLLICLVGQRMMKMYFSESRENVQLRGKSLTKFFISFSVRELIIDENVLTLKKKKTRDSSEYQRIFNYFRKIQSYKITKINPNLNISARMSLSISEILKPFKKLAVVFYQV